VHQLGVTLEELTPGARVGGIVASGAVTVLHVKWHGSNAVTVTYADDAGRSDHRLLYRDHQPSLWLVDSSRAYAFDGDPALFRLAAEALRIRMAALFDPMLAVTTSDLDPLPHQIRAGAPDGQLRPAVEPEPDRAAVRPHPPHRADRGVPAVEPGRR
jgi:hypothetical protein